MDQAKAMVNFLREALNRFSNTAQTGYLDKQGARFQKETQTVIRPAVESDLFRMKAIELGIKLFDSVQAGGTGLQTVGSGNGKTYFSTYSGHVESIPYWGGDYLACTIEKVVTDQSKAPAFCRAVIRGSRWTPAANYSAALASAAGAIQTIRMVINPQVDGTFTYKMTKETESVYSSGFYTFPFVFQSFYMNAPTSDQITNITSGPYNYDATTGVNSYGTNCLTSITAGYDTSKTTRDSTSGSSTCTPWVGTGRVERTKGSGDSWAALKITGTMPPSQAYENPLSVGYDTVAVSLASTTVGTTDMKYAITGSVAAYETAKKGTVEVDATQVVKYELAEGSYVQATQTKDNSGNVTSENANALSLNIIFTGFNSKGVGTLTASDWKLDKNSKNSEPTKMVFDGTLSDTSSGGAGDVYKGKLTLSRPNYDKIDSTKEIAFGNDDGATVSFEGGAYAKSSTDYIKTSLAFSRAYSANAQPLDNASIRFEIAGGFVLTGSGVSNLVKDQPATIKLQNQDGLRIWALPGKDTAIYASDEKTELGVYKSLSGNTGNKAFFFKDGSVISLN